MDITGSTALITGANRGMGRHYAEQLLERGARKVYATARRPELLEGLPGITPLRLDITDPASVAAAAEAAQDVTLLINNAGISTITNLLGSDLATVRLEMETHYFGTLNVVRAFAPVLGRGGGGAILNVLSAMSWMAYDGVNAYGAAKAAQWSLTNGIRVELAGQGTQVVGLHVGAVDTEMMAGWDVPKSDPADVVRQALDGVQAGELEVLADEDSRALKASLSRDLRERYPGVTSSSAM